MKTAIHLSKKIIWALAIASLFSACNNDNGNDNLGSGEIWKPTKEELSKKASLQDLDLSKQSFVGVSEEIAQFKSLKKLKLSSNNIKTLPSELGELTSVIQLNLSKNKLSEFPVVILKMEQLQELDLRYNKIKKIPESIGNLKELHTLYLAGNEIDDAQKSNLRDWLPKTKLVFGTTKYNMSDIFTPH